MADQNLLAKIIIAAEDKASSVFDVIKDNAGKVAGVIAGFFTVDFFKKSTDDAAKFEEQMGTLQGVIEATGGAAGLTKEDIEAMAKRIGDPTEIRAAAAELLTFKSVGKETFETTLQLSKDLATTGFGTIEGNAVQLGKALEDPVKGLTSLTKSGVTFTESEQDMIAAMVESGEKLKAQGIILDAVAKQVGGASEGADVGLNGAIGNLTEAFQYAREELGTGFLPILTKVYNGVADFVTQIRESGAIKSFSDTLASGFEKAQLFAEKFFSSVDFSGLQANASTFFNVLGQLVDGSLTLIGQFANAVSASINIFKDTGGISAFNTLITSVIQAATGLISGFIDVIQSMFVKLAETGALTKFYNAFSDALTAIIGLAKTLAQPFNDLFALLGNTSSPAKSFGDALGSVLSTLADTASAFVNALTTGIDAISVGFNGLAGVGAKVMETLLSGISALESGLAKVTFGEVSQKWQAAADESKAIAEAFAESARVNFERAGQALDATAASGIKTAESLNKLYSDAGPAGDAIKTVAEQSEQAAKGLDKTTDSAGALSEQVKLLSTNVAKLSDEQLQTLASDLKKAFDDGAISADDLQKKLAEIDAQSFSNLTAKIGELHTGVSTLTNEQLPAFKAQLTDALDSGKLSADEFVQTMKEVDAQSFKNTMSALSDLDKGISKLNDGQLSTLRDEINTAFAAGKIGAEEFEKALSLIDAQHVKNVDEEVQNLTKDIDKLNRDQLEQLSLKTEQAFADGKVSAEAYQAVLSKIADQELKNIGVGFEDIKRSAQEFADNAVTAYEAAARSGDYTKDQLKELSAEILKTAKNADDLKALESEFKAIGVEIDKNTESLKKQDGAAKDTAQSTGDLSSSVNNLSQAADTAATSIRDMGVEADSWTSTVEKAKSDFTDSLHKDIEALNSNAVATNDNTQAVIGAGFTYNDLSSGNAQLAGSQEKLNQTVQKTEQQIIQENLDRQTKIAEERKKAQEQHAAEYAAYQKELEAKAEKTKADQEAATAARAVAEQDRLAAKAAEAKASADKLAEVAARQKATDDALLAKKDQERAAAEQRAKESADWKVAKEKEMSDAIKQRENAGEKPAMQAAINKTVADNALTGTITGRKSAEQNAANAAQLKADADRAAAQAAQQAAAASRAAQIAAENAAARAAVQQPQPVSRPSSNTPLNRASESASKTDTIQNAHNAQLKKSLDDAIYRFVGDINRAGGTFEQKSKAIGDEFARYGLDPSAVRFDDIGGNVQVTYNLANKLDKNASVVSQSNNDLSTNLSKNSENVSNLNSNVSNLTASNNSLAQAILNINESNRNDAGKANAIRELLNNNNGLESGDKFFKDTNSGYFVVADKNGSIVYGLSSQSSRNATVTNTSAPEPQSQSNYAEYLASQAQQQQNALVPLGDGTFIDPKSGAISGEKSAKQPEQIIVSFKTETGKQIDTTFKNRSDAMDLINQLKTMRGVSI